MALAEARAAWQRTANRCLVQEDAKRAPKLACCSSASPSVKQVDKGPTTADGKDATSLGFPPYSQDSPYLDFPHNSRWWLQHQPNYGCQRMFANDQLNSQQSGMESVGSNGSSFVKVSVLHLEESEGFYTDDTTNTESLLDSCIPISDTPVKKDIRDRKQEDIYARSLQNFPTVEYIGDYCEVDKKDSVGSKASKKADEICFDPDCNWFGDEKTEPWWRSTDKDELAHLVAQRSLTVVENCDLPQPLKARVKKDVSDDLCCFDHDATYVSSADPKPGILGSSKISTHEQGKLISESSYGRKWEGRVHPGTENLSIRTDETLPEARICGNDPSKAQLLEALRHSQTRAREAEIAANQAYAEKEHIVKLVFRQASQLFAYKQWFQLLQLENLYYQIRNSKPQSIATVLPIMLPSVGPQRPKKLRKNLHIAATRGKLNKRGCKKYDISKYAVVFAVGLSLVGAGLLLGWTVGWMLPTF